jgi:hypothetical protein
MSEEDRIRKAARSAGKRTEARWAELLLGKRIPSPGRASRDMTSAYPVCVEMKHWEKKIPEWMREGLAQAAADAEPHEIRVFIRHEKFQRWQDDVVMMTGIDFMRIMRTVGTDIKWEDGDDL